MGTTKREYPNVPVPAVSGVIFDDDERVLLIRRASQPAKGKWSLPGGGVHLGEELEVALKREVMEECGLEVEVGPLLAVFSRIVRDERGRTRYHFVLLDYLCRYIDGTPKAGSDASEVKWVDVSKVQTFDLTKGVLEVIHKGLKKKDKC